MVDGEIDCTRAVIIILVSNQPVHIIKTKYHTPMRYLPSISQRVKRVFYR
jgi:hypothetical protein